MPLEIATAISVLISPQGIPQRLEDIWANVPMIILVFPRQHAETIAKRLGGNPRSFNQVLVNLTLPRWGKGKVEVVINGVNSPRPLVIIGEADIEKKVIELFQDTKPEIFYVTISHDPMIPKAPLSHDAIHRDVGITTYFVCREFYKNRADFQQLSKDVILGGRR